MAARSIAGLIAVSLLVGSVPAVAQVALLEGAVKNVESLSFYYLYGGFHPRSRVLTTSAPRDPANQTGFDGFGFELSLGVGSTGGGSRKCRKDELPETTPGDTVIPVDTLDRYTEEKTVDGKLTRTEYLKKRTKPEACEDPVDASFQVALGYSQIGGFAAQDTSFDLRVALRELPSISFYVTHKPESSVSQYFGIRAGIVQLHSLRAYDTTGVVYSGGGSAFQAGIAAGIVADIGGVNFFVEPSYNVRKFNSIEWAPVSNAVPRRFPRELSFSGWQVAFGMEVSIKPEP